MALTEQPASHQRPAEAPLPAYPTAAHLPLKELPHHGLGLDPAYELISSNLLLDGQARLNLAAFVTTWMPSMAGQLMAEVADKNIIDKDEYPQTAQIESRCVNILAR